MLYELDNKLLIINKTLQDLMIAVSYLKYETDLVAQMQNRLNRMYSSIHGLRFDTDSLYEFMRALASEQLNPMIIPPDILRNILREVQNDIRTNAHLKLPNDPVTKIWSYLWHHQINANSTRRLPYAYSNHTPWWIALCR